MSEIDRVRRVSMTEKHTMVLFQWYDGFGIRRSSVVDLEVQKEDGSKVIYPMLLPIKVCSRPADEMNFDDPDIDEYTEEEIKETYKQFMDRHGVEYGLVA